MTIKPSSQVLKIEPSPTLVLVSKAKQLAAEGKDVISLSVGEPDWPTLAVAKQAGVNAINEDFTRYTPARGIAPLRQAIVDQANKDFNTNYDTNNVTVATGGKFVIYSLLYSLLEPGDEVLIPEPFWVSYPTIVSICGGVVKPLETKEANGFKLTASELEKSITDKTRLLLLNSPSNPTGNLYTQTELNELAAVIEKHPNLLVLSDDIYNRLSFDFEVAPHLLKSGCNIADQVFLVNGISKSYAMTGWRIGWAIGNNEIMAAMGSFQSQTTSSACSISQKAALAAIQCDPAELTEIKTQLKERRDFAVSKFNSIDMLSCAQPDGAFYIWLDVSKTFGKSYKGSVIHGSSEFAKYLLDDYHVVVVPGKPFNGEGYVRVSYAVNTERMTQALERLQTFLNTLT